MKSIKALRRPLKIKKTHQGLSRLATFNNLRTTDVRELLKAQQATTIVTPLEVLAVARFIRLKYRKRGSDFLWGPV